MLFEHLQMMTKLYVIYIYIYIHVFEIEDSVGLREESQKLDHTTNGVHVPNEFKSAGLYLALFYRLSAGRLAQLVRASC